MIKRLLLLAAFFLLPTLSFAQTAAVTGHILYPSGGASANGKACFTLQNFKPNSPRVSGTGVIVQNKNFCVNASSVDGSFSTTLYRNDQITPGSTYWRVDFLWNGQQESSANYSITTSTYNLDSATPITTTPLPASGLVTSSYNCQNGAALSTWTCVHNFNDKNVTVTVYDLNGAQIFPNSLTLTDANTVTLTWITPQAGNAVIIHASAIAIAISQANAVLQSPSGSQTINSAQALTINAATTHTGNNTHSGTETFTGTTTAGLLNNCYTVDGVQYTTIQAAINAAPAGGCVYIPAGNYAPTSTISITKPLTVSGSTSNTTSIFPTAAVTGSVFSINPSTQQQVILKNFQLYMVNIPTITAITINNAGANSEIANLIIDRGTIGIDITNTSVTKFHDLYITNQTLFNIRDNGDGGSEHHYDSIWLINNNAAVAPTTTALFEYIRTTSVDTGGLYLNAVRAIQNSLGGVVTNAFLITSSAGSRSIIHSFWTDTICDGVTGGDCGVFNNIQRLSLNGGQWGVNKANQNCAAATVSCFASLSLIGSSQVFMNNTINFNSNNRDISISGNTDRITINGTHLLGSATGTTGGHLYVVTGAVLSNLTILNPDYDSSTTYSNNEPALIAGSNTQPQMYSNLGKISIADGGTCATPAINFLADTTTGLARVNTSTVALCGGSSTVAKWTASNFQFVLAATPSVAGGADLGTTALPFGNLWLGTAATNNFKFQPATTSGARIITIADPLSPTTVGLPLTIANGTTAMTTALIATIACGTTATTAATGVLTTDVIDWSMNAAVTAANNGLLILKAWPTAGNVNFNYCNPTAAGVTPTAMTVNWSVRRP